nr:VapC toxin family PIN domain ribonuclease [Pseudaminobacter soli]
MLVRVVVHDDEIQARIAFDILSTAELVAVSLPYLCELVRVLDSVYGYPPSRIADAIRAIADAENVATDGAAVEAGLAVLAAGGDFAGGVIARAGQGMGGETFVSFDRRAVSRVGRTGMSTKLADTFQ